MLDRAHAEFYLMLTGLLLARREEVVERVADVFDLSAAPVCGLLNQCLIIDLFPRVVFALMRTLLQNKGL